MAVYSSTNDKKLYGLGGQPGRFTTALFVRMESTPRAPVGWGPPMRFRPRKRRNRWPRRAPLLSDISQHFKRRLAGQLHVSAVLFGGNGPSTTRMNLPLFSATPGAAAASA